ncbi:polysaccharide deacetylase family protein [Oceanicoccus sagamiensis]|uniref:NodB homology domain-containing protein n=1 Tax=Oceanicoccus sagamiensis TaxID=716816 RepID=A0A1X9N7F3_9GAMM|nr:polysaccharide deacetylase family protein [Oceanicoccus sagamiensis]ARN73616.1 hypothetical protein BST96_05470 [Oceanicoccus sagamiensis]
MLSNPKVLLKAAKQLLLESTFSKSQYIELDKCLVSFTFDDVPVSAVTHGAKILEDNNVRGTYYVASGINPDGSSFLAPEHMYQLADAGHEIGCHTFHHTNLRWASGAATIADCSQNTQAIQKILPEYAIKNFAYPFGSVGPRSKRVLRNLYTSMRTSDEGLNVGKTDLSHLRAVSLYSETFSREHILNILEQAIQKKAWLVFYTHDVADDHGPWGTSIDDFQWVVDQCANRQCEILRVDAALKKIGADS